MTPLVVLIEDTPCEVEKTIGSLLKEVAKGLAGNPWYHVRFL
jgi:hypothetical protein